jgi:hypothetical protein
VDCLHGPRGLSGLQPRTVRTCTADRPALSRGLSVKANRTSIANPEKRTVCVEHADCPPGTRGLSTPLQRTVRNLFQPKLKTKTDQKRSRERTRRTRDQLSTRGLSTSPMRTVCASRTQARTTRPRRSTPPTHHRISLTVEAVETRVWGHDKSLPRMLYPKNFAS